MDLAHVVEALAGSGGVLAMGIVWLRERSKSRAKIEELRAETEAGRERALTELVQQLTQERRDATPAGGIRTPSHAEQHEHAFPDVPPELAAAVVGPYRVSPPREELDRALSRVERLEKIIVPLAAEVVQCRRERFESQHRESESQHRESECLRALDAVWDEYQGYRASIDPHFVPRPRPVPAPLTRQRAPRPPPRRP